MKKELHCNEITNFEKKATLSFKISFQKFLLGLFLMFINGGVWGQVNIIPERSIANGFSTWMDIDVTGTTSYPQLLKATSSMVTPTMNFDIYSNETLDFKARTFGGVSPTSEHVITISISINDGVSWTVVGTRIPNTNSMVNQIPFDLSSYSGTQIKIKFSVAGTSNTIGVGIEAINLKGIVLPSGNIVTFNPNFGTGTMPDQTASTPTNLNPNTFTRSGYTFSGWNTVADGSGTSYANTDNFPFTANTTLYAQWTINQYNVSYDLNVGSGTTPTTQTGNYNSNIILANDSGFSRPGYVFNGWNTMSNGSGTSYVAGATYAIPATNNILYAQWQSTLPFITTAGTLAGVNTIYGTVSVNTSFTVSAGNLTANLIITPPAGFEISTTAGSGFATSLNLGSGNQTNTPIYVRLAAISAVGTYNGNITITSATESVNKATANSTISPKALTISGISATDKIYDGTTSVVISGTPTYNGLVNSETFAVTGIVSWAFSSKDFGTGISIIKTGNYTAPSTNYTVTQPVLSANITKKALTITSPTIASKVYDGSTIIGTITTGTLSGLIASETLVVAATGTYVDANIGTAKPATIIYALANGTNGGLAINYFLANGTGFGNITAAMPSLTASTITLNVGGTYGLPGANVTSNSAGALSYSLTSGGNVTLSGTTLTGAIVGQETLTVTQAAFGNYALGSVNVMVNVSAVTYANGDYRTNPNATNPIFFNSTSVSGGVYPWQTWNGSAWVDVTGSSATVSPQGLSVKPENIYLNHSSVDLATGATYKNIIVEGGYVFSGNTTTGLTIDANKSLDIKAGYVLMNGRVSFLANSNLFVRSNGELEIGTSSSNFLRNNTSKFVVENSGYVYINNYLANIWTGNESFANGSVFTIYGWLNSQKLFDNESDITSNTTTNAKFGYLNIELASGTLSGNWTYVFPNDVFKLTNNDFQLILNDNYNISLNYGEMTIENNFIIGGTSPSNYIQAVTQTGNKKLLVKGDVIKNGVIEYRQIAAGSISDLEIGGSFSINAGKFNLNQTTSVPMVSNIKLRGNLYISNSGILSSVSNLNNSFSFIGTGQIQTINVLPANTANIIFNVNNGAHTKLINQNFTLGTNSKFNVLTNGTLNFGFNGTTALNITGNGTTGTGFTTQSSATLIITSPQGIMGTSGNIGNVQTNTAPSINQNGNFHFVGKENQETGTGLTATTSERYVFVNLLDNTKKLRLTNRIGITTPGKLEIQKGTLIGEEAGTDDKDFYGTGNLIMSDGEYKISTITANPATDFLPQLNSYSTYSLTGGTIHLNGSNANQVLSGIPVYKNLTFSGINVLGNDDKKISKAIEITDKLEIKETAILNSESKGVTGLANVTMDGGRWRISKLTNTQPELSGTYALTGGTMEFYGTTTNTNQKIKGGITYYNIDVNADAANTNYLISDEFYNVSPSSSFVLNGNLNANAPAIFKISSTHSITGLGNISINLGSGLLYGSEYGIKTSGTLTTDGAIRNSGTRTFSNQASYGFIGGQATMVTGNGIPSSVENLFVVKTNATDEVTISNPNLTVKNKMILVNGNIATTSNILELGTDITNKGTLEYTSGFVKGIFKRWFAGTNSGNDSSLFPMATTTNKNRFAKIEYTLAPSTGGSVTAALKTIAMGNSGITALAAIPAIGTCVGLNIASTDDSGYWTLTKDAALSGGTFTGTFTKEDDTNTIPVCEMSLLKRDATDWTIQGTHLQPTGTMTLVTLSRSGLNSFNDFGFGSKRCRPNVWNGTIWSAGIPTISHNIIFEADFTTDANLMACECEIQSGKTLTVLANHTLDIQGNLNNSGTLNIENNGSLVQHNDFAVNTGNIVMKRNAQPMYRYDFSYWSSPLTLDSGYKLGDPNLAIPSLSPATLFDKYFFWNATSQAWNTVAYGNEVMIPGKGYIVRAPQTYSTTPSVTDVYEATFVGKPGNGIVSTSIIGTDKWNLIGNPYPSAVSADLFLSDALNTSVVDGTIYLWTHNSPPSDAVSGPDTYNYTANDYASYNFTGGTSTADNANSEPNSLVNTPNGFIAAGQSFFIKGTGGGNATFNNSMRSGANNNQFFRMASAENSSQNTLEKHRIWLNISNSQGAFNQALVGYVENATNNLDRGFDGELLGGNYVAFYSIIQEKNLAIQGRTLPFVVSDQVELGYKATISGNLKISIDHFDGLFTNQNIYLEDKTLNLIHDLKQSDYQFLSAVGTFDNRFVLRYTNENLGTDDFAINQNDMIIVSKNKNIKVISSKENIESIMIFDLLGRMIYENKKVHSMNFSVSEITANQQALIVKVQLENGAKMDKKNIYN